MTDRIACEFFLIRYVPNVVKQEFVNIGVLLREVPPVSAEVPMAEARFTRHWDQVLRLDREADIDLLDSMAKEISTRVRDESTRTQSLDDGEFILDLMRDSFSNSIQVSQPHRSLAETFVIEMDRLMRMYVEPA